MLKYGEANPLAVFGIRQLDHCPPHFTKVDFDLRVNEKVISDWIWANLAGRFWYDDYYYTSNTGSVEFRKCAAFEVPGEASMFALILDQINAFQSEW
jgi:hypothetical protein